MLQLTSLTAHGARAQVLVQLTDHRRLLIHYSDTGPPLVRQINCRGHADNAAAEIFGHVEGLLPAQICAGDWQPLAGVLQLLSVPP